MYLRPVLTYARKTTSSTQGDEEKLQNFERIIFRKVHEPVYNNDTEFSTKNK
jgi:hypothetical protein